MSTLKLDPSKPYIYLTVSNLWAETSLGVYTLAPPPAGQAFPVPTLLATIVANGAHPQGLQLPTKTGQDGTKALGCGGLRFAVAAFPSQTGTVQIDLRREQDKPQQPPWDAWQAQSTVSLQRSDTSAPVYVEQDIALSGEAS